MSPYEPNCLGHAFFIARIDEQEQYRKPPTLGQLPTWFEFVKSASSAVVIAVLRGDKLNQVGSDEVEHMIARVGTSAIYSHRPAEGGDVECGLSSVLLSEYINALGVFYMKFLIVK